MPVRAIIHPSHRRGISRCWLDSATSDQHFCDTLAPIVHKHSTFAPIHSKWKHFFFAISLQCTLTSRSRRNIRTRLASRRLWWWRTPTPSVHSAPWRPARRSVSTPKNVTCAHSTLPLHFLSHHDHVASHGYEAITLLYFTNWQY